jgi:hypothetical protein
MTDDPIFERVMCRWAKDPDGAKLYLGKVVVQEPARAGSDAFLSRLPLPLAEHGRQARDAHAAKVARTARDKVEADEAREQAEVARKLARLREIQTALAPLSGLTRITALAGLTTEERDRVATGPERTAAIAMRKTALMSGDVRKRLRCTTAELNRWHADGRLPHLFTRKMAFEKATLCRLWSAEQITEAEAHLPAWREQDRIRKTFARTGLKPTKG